MSIEEIRAKQVAEQAQAIGQRREAESIVRIGDRIPLTGRHEVLAADGGIFQSGVKVYNAQEQYGDRVLALPRTDGTIALDSEKGNVTRPPTAFPHCPGYLNGQVFNCEVPKKKKPGKIWILYIHKHQLYVGGHQEEPELIYNPIPDGTSVDTAFSLLPLNVKNNILEIEKYAQIWGDREGWEASYGINNPVPLVGFAVERERKNSPSYVRSPFSIASSTAYSGEVPPQRLGKGLFLRYEGVSGAPMSGPNATSTRLWKNAIADFDGAPKGSGFSTSSRSLTGNRNGQTDVSEEIYPAPYSSKKNSDSFSSSSEYFPLITGGLTDGYAVRTYQQQNLNSFKIFYRDRTQSLFSRINSQYSEYADNRTTSTHGANNIFTYPVTIDYLVSDGRTDTILFSATGSTPIDPDPLGYYDRGSLGNNTLGFFGSNASLRSIRPTFNSPKITDLGDLGPFGRVLDPAKYKHLGRESEYQVRVYDVYSKSSLIDGFFEEVTLSAWGIPAGATILYTASYVGR